MSLGPVLGMSPGAGAALGPIAEIASGVLPQLTGAFTGQEYGEQDQGQQYGQQGQGMHHGMRPMQHNGQQFNPDGTYGSFGQGGGGQYESENGGWGDLAQNAAQRHFPGSERFMEAGRNIYQGVNQAFPQVGERFQRLQNAIPQQLQNLGQGANAAYNQYHQQRGQGQDRFQAGLSAIGHGVNAFAGHRGQQASGAMNPRQMQPQRQTMQMPGQRPQMNRLPQSNAGMPQGPMSQLSGAMQQPMGQAQPMGQMAAARPRPMSAPPQGMPQQQAGGMLGQMAAPQQMQQQMQPAYGADYV